MSKGLAPIATYICTRHHRAVMPSSDSCPIKQLAWIATKSCNVTPVANTTIRRHHYATGFFDTFFNTYRQGYRWVDKIQYDIVRISMQSTSNTAACDADSKTEPVLAKLIDSLSGRWESRGRFLTGF